MGGGQSHWTLSRDGAEKEPAPVASSSHYITDTLADDHRLAPIIQGLG